MVAYRGKNIALSLAAATTVAAHGHVDHIIVDGVQYQGFDPTSFTYMDDPPTVVGWSTTQTDNGFVAPDAADSPDIVCHRDGAPAGGYAEVAAGGKIGITWDTWPESHHGPVIDYLANCNGDCSSVDKTALEFFKIDAIGRISGDGVGTWGDDVLIENDFTWQVQIPEDLAPGNYVLRHEIIALHSAGQANGAQLYPQCFNLKVTGSGSNAPSGIPATEFYTPTDAGIKYDIYGSSDPYTIPGPALIEGVPSSIDQAPQAATATSSATVGGAAGGSADATPTANAGNSGNAGNDAGSDNSAPAPTTKAATSSAAATSKAAATTKAATTKAATTTKVSGGAAPNTTENACTIPTGTQPPASGSSGSSGSGSNSGSNSGSGSSSGSVAKYGQCGGKNFKGATQCAEGSTCKSWNDYYSQCV